MKFYRVIMVNKVTLYQVSGLNFVISKVKSNRELKDVFASIQHMVEWFFDDEFTEGGLLATHDAKEDIIEFRDEDGTLIYYIKNINI